MMDVRAPATGPAQVATNGRIAGSIAPATAPGHPRRRRLLGGLAAFVLVIIAASVAISKLTFVAPPTPPPAPPMLTAHGVIQPSSRASIATMSGGVVRRLDVGVGDQVEEMEPIARVNLGDQPELLLAPWAGTITGVNVQLGDSVMPGNVLVTLADLSRYRVETTDVDEYLISHIQANQAVTLIVESLDRIQLDGFVRSVALQQRRSTSGDNYPVIIDFASTDAGLRPGMTVRVTFTSDTE